MKAPSRTGWGTADLPSMAGRTIVITGANSGLGLSTARDLAGVGAHVVLAVRDQAKGRAAAELIAASTRGRASTGVQGSTGVRASTEVRHLDLASLASVRAFADGWDRPIDVLVNNAGVMMLPFARTADGFEMQMGTNHLGHFALTNLLLPHITNRIVTVTSLAHRWGRIDLADLNYEHRKYQRIRAYGQAKLANLLFTAHLQTLLNSVASPVRSIAAHPGYSVTNLGSHTSNWFGNTLMLLGDKTIGQHADSGALPIEYAVAEDIPGNAFVGPDGPLQLRGRPRFVGCARAARDAVMARALWQLSERLTGTSFPLA